MTPPREPGQDSVRPGLRASLATPDAKGRNVTVEMLEFFQKQFAKVKD